MQHVLDAFDIISELLCTMHVHNITTPTFLLQLLIEHNKAGRIIGNKVVYITKCMHDLWIGEQCYDVEGKIRLSSDPFHQGTTGRVCISLSGFLLYRAAFFIYLSL